MSLLSFKTIAAFVSLWGGRKIGASFSWLWGEECEGVERRGETVVEGEGRLDNERG